MLNTAPQIQDSLETASRYICNSINFVSNLIRRPRLVCPFQVDICIAFNEARFVRSNDDDPSDDDDDEDIYDDDDDDDDDEDDETKEDAFVDAIGNVKQRVLEEQLPYHAAVIGKVDTDIAEEKRDGIGAAVSAQTTRSARMLMAPYLTFKNTQITKKYSGGEFDSYPRKHRFCALIDRRKPDPNDKDKGITDQDEVIFFEPPDNCNSFPKGVVNPLFYFNESRECIIPCKGYKQGSEQPDYKEQSQRDKALNKTITAKTSCNGKQMTVRVHVHEHALLNPCDICMHSCRSTSRVATRSGAISSSTDRC